MKKYLALLVITSAAALSGCATTSTKPVIFEQLGKYSTTPLNAQTYRLSFQARSNLSFSQAEEISLVNAAKTTLSQGFQMFKVLDDPSNRSQQAPRQAVVYNTPMYYPYGYGYGYRRGYWLDPFYDTPRVVDVEPVQIAYTIECYKTENAPKEAFDARLILQSLGAKYGLSATGEALPLPSTP